MMRILSVASYQQSIFSNQLFEMSGYETKTLFYQDFTIAELCNGIKDVKDTYNRAFKSWKSDFEYLTELVIVLNHKIWQHYQTNETLARCYDELWRKLHNYCLKNLKGEELEYYLITTD